MKLTSHLGRSFIFVTSNALVNFAFHARAAMENQLSKISNAL